MFLPTFYRSLWYICGDCDWSGGTMHTYTRAQLMLINNRQPVPRKLSTDVLQKLFGVGLIKPTRRGARAGSHKQRDIPVINHSVRNPSRTPLTHHNQTGVHTPNLLEVNLQHAIPVIINRRHNESQAATRHRYLRQLDQTQNKTTNIPCILLNAQSICNSSRTFTGQDCSLGTIDRNLAETIYECCCERIDATWLLISCQVSSSEGWWGCWINFQIRLQNFLKKFIQELHHF